MSAYKDKEAELLFGEIEKANSNSINFRNLFYLCVSKWYWFVISLAIVIGLAVIYLLTTPPIYTRSASLLIKEDGKGNSISDAAGVLGDIDIFQSNANVNNEIQSLQSPAVMYDVVKRLHLDINYTTDRRFYKQVLYGQTCPYQITFSDLQDNETVSLTIYPGNDNEHIRLTDFNRKGEDIEGEMEVPLNKMVKTPLGYIDVKLLHADSIRTPIYVTRIGLHTATSAYASRLNVALNDEKSTVINLTFDDQCIQRAEDVLNTLIAVYNENWVKDKNQIAVSTSMFINERLGVIEQELGNVDENISSYKSEHLLPDVQAAANMYMNQSSETGSQILALNTQLAMTRYVRNYLTGGSSQNQLLPANSGIESSAIEKQIADYNAMQLQRNNMVSNSSETNPLVRDMDQSLKNMRSAIISSIDNHIVTLNTQLRNLQQSEKQTTARIAANPTQGKYLLSVERQQKVKEALYLFLLQKREENELSQAFTAYNTRIIMPPFGSLAPTSPVKAKVVLIALIIGLFIPFTIIVARETLNTKVRGRKDLEKLSLPFAGEIPLAYGKRGKKKEEEQYVVIRQGSRNIINEAFRVLRTNLEFMVGSKEGGSAPVIIFTSFNPGSGKTFLIINTAASFSLKGKKVLVIDCDLRRASLSKYVGSPHKGLSGYLAKKGNDADSLIMEMPGYPSLYILPVGIIPPNPTELLAEPRFGELVEAVKKQYDYVFIDSPPIEIVADTQIIEKVADRTMFVVRAGLQERDMLPELQKAYDEKRYKDMAIVLNATEGGGSRYGYKYGYHYGYGKSDYYSTKDKS